MVRTIVIAVGVFVGLLGCAPRFQKPYDNQVFSQLAEDTVVLRDGAVLPLSRWEADQAPAAVVVAVHGYNDYRNAFSLIGPYLAKQGISVLAYDQRGFGQSKQRGIWPGQDLLVSDLGEVVKLVKTGYPGVPLYLLGDSMGGAVVITAMGGRSAPEVDGVILNAPAVWGKDTFNAFYRASLWIMAHTLPWYAVTGESVQVTISDNIDVLREMSRDPNMVRKTRFDSLYGLVKLMDNALSRAGQLQMPTLLLYGLRDEVIPARSICKLVAQLVNSPTVAYYPNGYHLLLRDRQAPVVWADVVNWIGGGALAYQVADAAGAVCQA